MPVPLVTSGPLNNPNGLALFGQPDTQVLFGNNDQSFGTSSGLRFDTGAWLDAGRSFGLEGGYFVLDRRTGVFDATSNIRGIPLLAEPLVAAGTGQEFAELIAVPGLLEGNVNVTMHTRAQGWDFGTVATVRRDQNTSFELTAGFRAVSLDEDLRMTANLVPLVPGFLNFLGPGFPTVDPPSTVTTIDQFSTQNHFYGPQVGGRYTWNAGGLNVSVLGKLALGVNQELVRIDGSTTETTPRAPTITVPAGVLALSSNSGRFFRDDFAFVPEFGLEVGYQFNQHVEAHVGYTFLYLSSVARPGDQIDRVVEPALVPTDPAFGTALGTPPGVFVPQYGLLGAGGEPGAGSAVLGCLWSAVA